ncbi:TolC family outer membrane protein [Massilia sp. NR 4-1]|uniref:TolC family outer membrane protein n=1 Tax=Massilia sp. NR 4-1 TaxID=1678028 RepID=UPI00067DDE19|nr:TolC family outer membrane protein [Massilia sp. NR 4-1]AKU20924.1 hypothetical protein ACZ75_04860 [Massilia sp. NR 4-1]
MKARSKHQRPHSPRAGVILTSLAMLVAMPAQSTDLLETYALARSADPTLQQAASEQTAAQESIGVALGPLLPQLAAGVQLKRVQRDMADLGKPGRSSSREPVLTLSQTLLDGRQYATLRSSRAQAASQESAYQAEVQALPVRVASAYFNVLLATEMLGYAQANEDAFGEQVRNADGRYRSGLSAQVEVVQARAYHTSAKSNTINARTTLDAARESLSRITGAPTGELKMLRDEAPAVPPQPASAEAWVAMALQHNPVLRSLRDKLEAAEHDIGGARAGHLPTLSASVSLGRHSTWPDDTSGNDGRRATAVGLALNFPLFAGGAVQAEVKRKTALREAARQSLEFGRRQVVADVRNAYSSVQAGVQQIAEARQAVEAASGALASTRVGKQSGTQSMTDVLLAIQLLTGQKIAYAQARHKLVLDILQLKQDAGQVGEADLAEINTQLR